MNFYKRKPDIIIRNGTIVDGTGALPYYADLSIIGDKIDYIGNLRGVHAPLEIDAYHKYVTPGFIDPHTHSDWTIWANPECQSSVRQGVTTEIVGNCGLSSTHILDGIAFDSAGDGIKSVYDYNGKPAPKGAVAAVLDKMDAMGASMNTAWLCGHNSLRKMAGVYTTEYTQDQFQIMADFLREAMEAGYVGFSTGLEFVPGIVSRPDEVERLAMIVAEYDANYSSHMRDEGTYLFEAINEFLNVIRKTGLRGTISHLNVKYDNGIPDECLQKGMQMLRDARTIEHLNVMCDMLPTCFASGFALAMLPPWLYANGWEQARETLLNPVGRERVKADMNRYWRFLAAGQWDRLLYLQPTYMKELATTPFNEAARAHGREPADFFLDVIAAAPTMQDAQDMMMQGIVFHEQTMIDSVVKDPIYMWQTDSNTTVESGELAKRTANIQHYMSMTHFFVRYVRELNAISIQDAVKKATSIPAKHFQLEGRGVLEVGAYADINVFDLNELKINATFSDVCRYSSGMHYVLVNGTPVLANGVHTGARAGKVLRHLPK